MNVIDRIESDLTRAWDKLWREKEKNSELEAALYKIALCSDPTAQHSTPIDDLMAAIHKYARNALQEGKE